MSILSLHLTCTTYDFSYNILMTATETSQFGSDTSLDGEATGAIANRILPSGTNVIYYLDEFIPVEYPPSTPNFFTPSSSLGKAMFTSGTVTGTAGNAEVDWTFTPAP